MNDKELGGSMLPVGAGKRPFQDKELIPTLEVKNELIWINSHINLPIKLTIGEPTPLGLFAAGYPESGDKKIQAVRGHGRSLILGQFIFSDDDGRKYRDVDLKGAGYIRSIKGNFTVKNIEPKEEGQGASGLQDSIIAQADSQWAETLLSLGVRSYRAIAIIKLGEIIVSDETGNHRISIDDARARGMIPKNIEPAIAVRGFGTRTRIDDLEKAKNPGWEIDDARKLVAQELGIPEESFTKEKYVRWFAREAGRSLGIMQREGLTHGYLHPGNIALDARLLDLDTMQKHELTEPKRMGIAASLQEVIQIFKKLDYAAGDNKIKSSDLFERDIAQSITGLLLLKEFTDVDVTDHELIDVYEMAYQEALKS